MDAQCTHSFTNLGLLNGSEHRAVLDRAALGVLSPINGPVSTKPAKDTNAAIALYSADRLTYASQSGPPMTPKKH